MDTMNLLESLFRWLHVVVGVLWIGLLYFFNWVNSAFAPTLDAESKKKVIPELLPRALFWFRWGAAWTWISGVVLLTLVYYHTKLVFDDGVSWGLPVYVALVLTFLGVYIYDILQKTVLKNPTVNFVVMWVLVSLALYLFDRWAGFSFRGYAIHLGAMFGSTMAFNVWYRIWPAQKKIVMAIKNGEAPDPALIALAGTRSKHNTYMSIPLLFTMVSQHATWAATPGYVSAIVLVGWLVCLALYNKAKTVPGF